MKRLFALLLALSLLLTPALAVPQRPANGYVADSAGVLSDELEQHIIDQNKSLFQTSGAEIGVVAVDYMDGLDAESYTLECFDAWGLGDESAENGLLLTFAVRDNKVWAMRGVGLEDALSVSTLNGWLEDYFYDDYDAGDYESAVRSFFDAAYNWMERYYAGSSGAPAPGPQGESHAGASPLVGRLVSFTVTIFVILVIFILLAAVFRPRRYYGGYYNPYPYRPWPYFFWRRRRRYGPPAPPRPPSYRPHTGSGSLFHSGGSARGGGAGRMGTGFRSSSSSRGSFRSSGGGSFRSGGHSRGGGAGRR